MYVLPLTHQVRFAVAEAMGFMGYRLSKQVFDTNLPKVIPALLAMLKKEPPADHLPITMVMEAVDAAGCVIFVVWSIRRVFERLDRTSRVANADWVAMVLQGITSLLDAAVQNQSAALDPLLPIVCSSFVLPPALPFWRRCVLSYVAVASMDVRSICSGTRQHAPLGVPPARL